VSHHDVQAATDFFRVLSFHIEKRPHDDAQSQAHNFLMDVDYGAVLPSGEHLLRIFGDDAGVECDSFAMKGGLAEPALLLPVISFAGKQTVSEKPTAVSDHLVLEEVLMVAD